MGIYDKKTAFSESILQLSILGPKAKKVVFLKPHENMNIIHYNLTITKIENNE